MLERRFDAGFREAGSTDPGLVQEDDGSVWYVKPDGSRIEVGGGGGGASAFAKVALATPFSQGGGGRITVPFDTVVFDPDELWDATGFQFVAKVAGWYLLSFGIESNVSGDVTTGLVVVLTVNGPGDNVTNPAAFTLPTDPATISISPFSGWTHLRIGDGVEADIVWNNGRLDASGVTFALACLYPD